ncbi:helix-turn-helix transcriptional regulator [Caviibacterium pharyngocola]|uniref:WYL domain-containing protein n=1 Tax=Caviibacterium pharyngocola TaxID=28159 RepID=A0A2M8RX24_9PAST|nr:WYL domain-containing protein [Caviibacterium pharyngocola]PJG83431.1 WYL domain-containing protein [Caviibacterium pharyngocola]
MPKRPENIETTFYHLDILRRIPKGKGRYITAKALHEQLEELGYQKDIRTMQRTLKSLCEHFDIEKDDRSREHAYRWKEYSKGLDIPNLTAQESLLLMLAEQHLKNLLPANIMKSLKPFFDEARYQKQFGKESPEYKWLDKVCSVPTSQPLLPAKISPTIFDAVSTALFQNKLLHIEYQNQQGNKKKATVMPLALAQQGGTIYLIARYEGFDNQRLLALHRLKKPEVSTFNFERPKDFSLSKYLDDGYLGFSCTGQKVRLTFSIAHSAGFHLTETPLSKDQIILEETPDYYRIQATVADSDMLEWWIRKFGEDIWDIEKVVID